MLFEVEPRPRLVGIAKLAAQAQPLRLKREAVYLELTSRSILNRCSSPRMPFTWTINSYRGCEFGCRYCYARYTHEFLGHDDGALFEKKIYAKTGAAEILRRELQRDPRGAIAIGTSTDPYQPAERRFLLTRRLLEVLSEERGRTLSVTTKSDLVARDCDVLAKVAKTNDLSVNMTVTTLDAELARRLEPRAPRPDLRLGAVARLTAAGVVTGVFVSPLLPELNDSPAELEAIAKAASAAGASYFGGRSLFLMPSAQQQFFPFLEREFPELAARYHKEYGARAYLRPEYERELGRRVAAARQAAGLDSRPKPSPVEAPPSPQLRLFE